MNNISAMKSDSPVATPADTPVAPYVLLLAALAVAAYLNSFAGVFLLDDLIGIKQGIATGTLSGWISGSSRPLTGATFHLSSLLGGGTLPFHAGNLLIHLAAALALFGWVRRTLLMARPAAAAAVSPGATAFAIASIWMLHPLQTESVTYISQRAESLAGLFAFLTLYCFARGAADRRLRWLDGSILACALGMASKAVMVAAPLAVLLYDRLFLSASFREALRRRWWFYILLAATWALPLLFLTAGNESSNSAGLSVTAASPWEYFVNQPAVIAHYLRLAFWPAKLCLDYAWDASRPLAATLPAAIAIGILLLGSVILYARRRVAGFCGLWWFLWLAPTSSFFPVTDLAAEHRVYTALAGIAAGVVLAARAGIGRLTSSPELRRLLFGAATAAVLLALMLGTVNRNLDYASAGRMWSAVVRDRPDNIRAYLNLAASHLEQSRHEEALAVCKQAIARMPEFSQRAVRDIPTDVRGSWKDTQVYMRVRFYAHANNYAGVASASMGRFEDAIRYFEEAIRQFPTFDSARGNLARARRELAARRQAVPAPDSGR